MDRKKRFLNRILLVCGTSAVLLLAGYVWYLKRPSYRFYFPEGFRGWVTVKFEKPGTKALTEENGALRFDVPPDGILETSSSYKEGWGKDFFFQAQSNGKWKEMAKNEEINHATLTRIQGWKSSAMRYDSLVLKLPNPSDTVLWDGGRISRNGDAVEIRPGRPVLLHFYYSPEPIPYFSLDDSLPVVRTFW
jgi:hypothetical protein